MRTASPPRGIAVGGVVAALALLACGAAPAADPLTAVGDELAVGQNRTGESCRLRLLESHTDRTGFQRFGMFCEGWTQPTGEVRRFAASRDYPAARLLTDSGFQKSFETRVGDCGPVETTALASGTPAALRECRRHDGGWRVLVLAATIDKRNYGLETFPTNLPLLEIAVEILEGRRPAVDSPLTQGSISAAIRRAEAMVDARGTLTGIRDVGAHATFIRLGILRHYQGDYPGSEEAFRRALEIEERVGGRDLPSSGRTIAWIAIDAGYLGRFEEAEQVYDRADPLVRRSSARGDLANYLEQRSSTERLRGRPTVALPLAEEAVRLREQREGLNSEGLAHALVSVGRIQLDLKQLAEAERIVARGLAIVEKPGPDAEFRAYWTAESEEWLGRIHTEQKRFADARAQFEASLARRRLLFGDSIKVADSYRMLGELGRIEGNRPASLAAFRKEAEIRAGDPVARNRARPETIVPYLNALLDAAAATPAEGDALRAEAFAAAQIPREGDTARAITNMAARLDAGDPALGAAAREYQEALRRREAARRELALATLAPADKRDPAREAALGRELESAETAAASREERLQAEFPRYAGLVAPRPLTVGELAGLLRPEEALLSILSTRNATYVFLVRGGRVHAHRAAVNASALDARVRGLRKGLDLADGQLHAFDVAAAHRLYVDLIGPVATELERATHLIVVPTGPLLSLPFGLLLTRPSATPADSPEKADYSRLPFLGSQLPISVLPSTGSLKSLRAVAGRSRAPQPFVGFGDPAFSGAPGDARNLAALGDLCREGPAVDAELIRGLPRLPETASELRQIARTLRAPESSVILGAQATEARVRATDLRQYRVVAFATHGLLPGDLKCKGEPALALTPPAAATPDEDGLLDAAEVAQLRLDADWVVLSACNTAAPDGRLGGQSLSGLARAFFYAGARSLLVSHWTVASQPTLLLTTGLFEAYAQSTAIGRAAALRTAQLKLLADPATSHPSFWAAFVLVGDGGAP